MGFSTLKGRKMIAWAIWTILNIWFWNWASNMASKQGNLSKGDAVVATIFFTVVAAVIPFFIHLLT